MTTAADRGWGDPTKPGYADKIFTTIHVAGIALKVHKETAKLWINLTKELAKHYNLAKKHDDWGAVIRPIRGYEDEWKRTHNFKYLSNHSWGLAVDFDAEDNPMTTDTHAKHEMVKAVMDKVLAPYRGRFIWGGNYSGARKDYMHVEFVGTLTDARVLTRQMGL
jgi:hypothetical protein